MIKSYLKQYSGGMQNFDRLSQYHSNLDKVDLQHNFDYIVVGAGYEGYVLQIDFPKIQKINFYFQKQVYSNYEMISMEINIKKKKLELPIQYNEIVWEQIYS